MASGRASWRLVAVACLLGAPPAQADGPPVAETLVVPSLDGTPDPLGDVLPDPLVLNFVIPAPVIDLRPGSAKPRKKKPLPTARPSQSDKSPLALTQGPLALDLSVPSPNDLSSGATLNLKLPDAALKAVASASVGKQDGEPAFWHRDSAQLSADVSGPLGTTLAVVGENRLELTYREAESVGASDHAAHLVRTENQSARIAMSVPIAPVQLSLGGTGSNQRTQEGSPGDTASFAQSAVRTADHSAYVSLAWQALPAVRIEGGTAVKVASISWQNAHASTYRTVNPNVKVDVKPLQDTTVTAKFEQVVSPYDAAAFARYSKADAAADASGFQPDHAWQLESTISQRVGAASISATYTATRQGTVAEFAELKGTQAPVTTPLRSRDSVVVALNVPLAAVGLPGTDLSSEARWQSSRVLDPVTSDLRAASGEVGQKMSLRLSHDLPAQDLSLGLTGEYTGARTAYQVTEISETAPSGAIGAFLSFRPGSYQVDLNVSALYGATTKDSFYRGPRGTTNLDRTLMQDNSGTVLNLSLKKPL